MKSTTVKKFERAPGYALRAGAAFLLATSIGPSCGFGAPQDVIKVTVQAKRYTGQVIAADSSSYVLLQRDGQVRYLNNSDTSKKERYKGVFRPFSAAQLKARLLKQTPKGYEVTNTGSYVVVHPKGAAKQWAFPFEKLSKRFTQYFEVRGFRLERSRFPLVVVVYATRNQFHKSASKLGVGNPGGIAGFYSPTTNQIMTYVQPTGLDKQWNSNHLTLIHEALHQFAFNKGIHSRWGPTPKWASEGLAVMFEAKGVYDSGRHPKQSDRVHKLMLKRLRQFIASGKLTGQFAKMVESDRLFQQNPELAYTLSWGLMFYLSENQPRQLAAYLKSIGSRQNFTGYESPERLNDFAKNFGANTEMLEARVARFVKGL